MAAKLVSDEEFIRLWQQNNGSPRQLAESTGMSERMIYKRRIALSNRGIVLQTNPRGNAGTFKQWSITDTGRA